MIKSKFFEDTLEGIKFCNKNKVKLISVVYGVRQNVKDGFFKWIWGIKGYLFIYTHKRNYCPK